MKSSQSPNNALPLIASETGANDAHIQAATHTASFELNKCSVPKSGIHIIENSPSEKQSGPSTYEQRLAKCKSDLVAMTAKALNHTYKVEYKTWSNCKYRAKTLEGISGPMWGTELDTFPGFLAHVGPRPNPKDSMDRIDPAHGYVVGNLRWASKQLQSKNRQNVRGYIVKGEFMNLHQVAAYLEMSYDALRMQLHRGKDVHNLIVNYVNKTLSLNEKAIVAKAQKVEACPWPEGREKDWEACYQAEKSKLLKPSEQNSRTAFFVAKCSKEWWHLNNIAMEYAEDNDMKSNPAYEKRMQYWQFLGNFAVNQRKIVQNAKDERTYNVGPTDEDFKKILELFG